MTDSRKVKAISMPAATLESIQSFCDERGARIGEVIETVMFYWIGNDIVMDTEIHLASRKLKRSEGRKPNEDIRVRLLPWLIEEYEKKRIKEKVGDKHGIPFGASIGCLWLDWWVNEGENFVPTPRSTNKGKKYNRKAK